MDMKIPHKSLKTKMDPNKPFKLKSVVFKPNLTEELRKRDAMAKPVKLHSSLKPKSTTLSEKIGQPDPTLKYKLGFKLSSKRKVERVETKWQARVKVLSEKEEIPENRKFIIGIMKVWRVHPIVTVGKRGRLIPDDKLETLDPPLRGAIRRGRKFRRYLKRTRFVKKLTKMLLNLYEMYVHGRRPDNPLNHLSKCVQVYQRTLPAKILSTKLAAERDNLVEYVQSLEAENTCLKELVKARGLEIGKPKKDATRDNIGWS